MPKFLPSYSKSVLRASLWPLCRSSQDKFLDEALKHASSTGKVVIITGPRGTRKSFTAQMAQYRFLGRRISMVDGSDDDAFEKFSAAVNLTFLQQLQGAFFSFLGPMFFAFICGCLWKHFENAKTTNSEGSKVETSSSSSSSWRDLWSRIKDEFPTRYSLACAFISILFASYKSYRKPIIIFDDPMNKFLTKSARYASTHTVRRQVLDGIRSVGKRRLLVILSSNEGLDACFDDRAPVLHHFLTFPLATLPEFHNALKDAVRDMLQNTNADGVADNKEYLKTLELETLRQITKRIPQRYALSIRWWGLLTPSIFEMLKSSDEKKLSAQQQQEQLREFLRAVVLLLDMASAEHFRTEALAHSPPLDKEERTKVATLVGLDSDALALLPEYLPGRLSLCWALVLADRKDVQTKVSSPAPAAASAAAACAAAGSIKVTDSVDFFMEVGKQLIVPDKDPISHSLWIKRIKPLYDLITSSLNFNLKSNVFNYVEKKKKLGPVTRQFVEDALTEESDETFATMSKQEIVSSLNFQKRLMENELRIEEESAVKNFAAMPTQALVSLLRSEINTNVNIDTMSDQQMIILLTKQNVDKINDQKNALSRISTDKLASSIIGARKLFVRQEVVFLHPTTTSTPTNPPSYQLIIQPSQQQQINEWMNG